MTWPRPRTISATCSSTPAGTARPNARYRESLALRQQLVGEGKQDEYRKELAGSFTNLGLTLQKLSQQRDAAAEFDASQKILRQLTAELPTDELCRVELARCCSNLGTLLNTLDDPARAMSSCTKPLGCSKSSSPTSRCCRSTGKSLLLVRITWAICRAIGNRAGPSPLTAWP